MIRTTLAALLCFLLTPGLVLCLEQTAAAIAADRPAVQTPADRLRLRRRSGATSTGAPQTPVAEPPGEGATTPEQVRRAAALAEMQPPDGEWLIDAEGRQYFIRERPKSQGFKRLDGGRVRISYGGEYELAGEDDVNLWLKIYRVGEEQPARRPTIAATTPEELAASAATFVAPITTVDRLHLRAFDAGLPPSGLWRNGFDLADINGDGEIDFVHGPTRRGGDQPKAFLGDGKGTWRPFRMTVPSGLLDYGDVKVADFNGDGKPDLATASHLRGVQVFVGDGAGNFSSWSAGLDFDKPSPGHDASGFSSRRIEILDWNRDGRPDLLAFSEGPRILILETANSRKVSGTGAPEVFGPKVYLNQGNGTWVAVAEIGERPEIFGDDLAVADFDGNGSPDFLTSSNAMGRMGLLHLQGKKVGGPWTSVDLPLRPRAYVNAVAVSDFDGDRRQDLALSYTSFELGVNRVGIDLYLGRRDGAWERRPAFVREGRVAFSALESGDLDGDKRSDLVATDYDGFLHILLGDGRGGFVLEESPEAQQPRGNCRGYGLRVADLDRDGRPEIVASFAGEGNALYDPLRCPGKGGVAAWTLQSPK